MKKGLYPAIVYVLLFSVGIAVFAFFYYFTDNFVSDKNLELEKMQAEKICYFLQSLKNKEAEIKLSIGNFRIETNPLKIVSSSVYNCNIGLNTSGSCSKECKIKVSKNRLVFS